MGKTGHPHLLTLPLVNSRAKALTILSSFSCTTCHFIKKQKQATLIFWCLKHQQQRQRSLMLPSTHFHPKSHNKCQILNLEISGASFSLAPSLSQSWSIGKGLTNMTQMIWISEICGNQLWPNDPKVPCHVASIFAKCVQFATAKPTGPSQLGAPRRTHPRLWGVGYNRSWSIGFHPGHPKKKLDVSTPEDERIEPENGWKAWSLEDDFFRNSRGQKVFSGEPCWSSQVPYLKDDLS